jgi:hypothetical protein
MPRSCILLDCSSRVPAMTDVLADRLPSLSGRRAGQRHPARLGPRLASRGPTVPKRVEPQPTTRTTARALVECPVPNTCATVGAGGSEDGSDKEEQSGGRPPSGGGTQHQVLRGAAIGSGCRSNAWAATGGEALVPDLRSPSTTGLLSNLGRTLPVRNALRAIARAARRVLCAPWPAAPVRVPGCRPPG